MNAEPGSGHRIVIRSLPARPGAAGEPVPPGRVIYCVPAAGTGARSFLVPFTRSPLRPHLRVVQLPGREDRLSDPCMDDVLEMAELVAEAIAAEGVEDYALFGHSFGAFVMFETARRLEVPGTPPPAVLAVAACPPPLVTTSLTLVDMQPADLVEELRGFGRLDSADELSEELAALMLPVLEADCDAAVRYLDGPARDAIAAPILAMSGAQDASVTPEKAAGWGECTKADFTMREYDGSHFFPVESDLPLRAVVEWERGPALDTAP